MPILSVVLYPDDPLRQVARPAMAPTPELSRLADDMLETMYALEGVGLAAPQVGVPVRMFVMHEPDGRARCLVNPEVLEPEGSESGEEGCLSLPQIYAQVPRATRIRVRALDLQGHRLDFEAQGFEARIIQHEADHLDGVVFLDRVDLLTRQACLQEWQEVRERLTTFTVRS